jgi:predicted nucleic acid-binding protein
MSYVLDASVALAWLLPGERTEAVDALADQLSVTTPAAPAIWPLEVANALLTARRRDRIADRDVDRMIELLFTLAVEVDTAATGESLARILAVSRRRGLTTYDAAYIELAQRRGWPLATIDAKLAEACRQEGVAVVPGCDVS